MVGRIIFFPLLNYTLFCMKVYFYDHAYIVTLITANRKSIILRCILYYTLVQKHCRNIIFFAIFFFNNDIVTAVITLMEYINLFFYLSYKYNLKCRMFIFLARLLEIRKKNYNVTVTLNWRKITKSIYYTCRTHKIFDKQ